MLPSEPSSTTCMNVFGEIQIAHKSLGSSCISSKGQTLGLIHQGLWKCQKQNWMKQKNHYYVSTCSGIQRINDKYFAQTFYFGDEEQANCRGEGQICSKSTRNFGEGVEVQGKVTRQDNENSQVLVELQASRQKINNMEQQSKDLLNIRMERDFLLAILKETDANYLGLKAKIF